MDSHCLIIGTLLVLIILYLLRERKEVDTRLKAEYEKLFAEWKEGGLQEELSRHPQGVTLVTLDNSIDKDKLLKALKEGEFRFKDVT